jgi:hypothetical protein
MANQWKTKPSELLYVDDPLAAYYLDRAVFYFGQAYEADIEDAVSDAKSKASAERAAQTVRDRWLRDGDEDTPQEESRERPAGFKDPAEVFREMNRKRHGG